MTEIAQVNSLFEQPWWLEAVAPGRWQAATVEVGGELRARLPYVLSRARGVTRVGMPPLTQTLGPWLMPSDAKYAKQLAQQKDLLTALILQLPAHDHLALALHPSLTNHLPFYWQGFTQTTRYTYALELDDLERVWQDFQDNIRREIRKARKLVGVRSDRPLSNLLDTVALTFSRQHLPSPYPPDLVARLDAACTAREARRMFFAEDGDGRLHAAIYLVWDERSAYYLMGGGDPELRSSGAMSLLMWEAVQFAASVTRRFDFEGSMLEPVERFFRAFGARQVPYFHVSHMSRRMRLLRAGRSLAKEMLGRP